MILEKQLAFVPVLAILCQLVQSTPEKDNCEDVEYDKVPRMRDTYDCTKFYYCEKYREPVQASCPNYQGVQLYFEPTSGHCDFKEKAPKSCFEPPTTTEPTTTVPTTTTRAPRPPVLDDPPGFEIDCKRKQCGIFPNTYGPCGTYAVCNNGEKVIKKCHAGQMFDINTMECQPAKEAKCWEEPIAEPHIRIKGQEDCPFHGNAAARPIETRLDGVILQNPIVTNWGNWQPWVECPPGMYATGMYAWRRLLIQGWNRDMDHAGIVSVSFLCQTPGGNETQNFIESLAPGLPHDGWPFYYMCKGAVVGIRLNSASNGQWGRDNLATDNIQGMCSCSGPIYKPYEEIKYAPQNGNRGTWTAPQYCKRYQALCGMQTQMVDYIEYQVGKFDNTGMNNIKVKCCDVPDPLENCVPKEELVHIRDCDDSTGGAGLRCDFEAEVGLAMEYDTNQKLVDFYSSVGYTFNDYKQNLSSQIKEKLKEQMANGAKLMYEWDDIPPSVMVDMKVTKKTLYVKEYEKLELHQVVGRCDHFLVRTNRYQRTVTDGRTGRVKEKRFFEI